MDAVILSYCYKEFETCDLRSQLRLEPRRLVFSWKELRDCYELRDKKAIMVAKVEGNKVSVEKGMFEEMEDIRSEENWDDISGPVYPWVTEYLSRRNDGLMTPPPSSPVYGAASPMHTTKQMGKRPNAKPAAQETLLTSARLKSMNFYHRISVEQTTLNDMLIQENINYQSENEKLHVEMSTIIENDEDLRFQLASLQAEYNIVQSDLRVIQSKRDAIKRKLKDIIDDNDDGM